MLSKPSLTTDVIEAVKALDDRLRRGPPFSSTADVLDALGGVNAVARLTKSKTTAVAAWGKQEHFPSRFYCTMLAALHAAGLHAPAWLWGMALADEGDSDTSEVA
jgi:hypothetical protein